LTTRSKFAGGANVPEGRHTNVRQTTSCIGSVDLEYLDFLDSEARARYEYLVSLPPVERRRVVEAYCAAKGEQTEDECSP
jgi:hypothetical protein